MTKVLTFSTILFVLVFAVPVKSQQDPVRLRGYVGGLTVLSPDELLAVGNGLDLNSAIYRSSSAGRSWSETRFKGFLGRPFKLPGGAILVSNVVGSTARTLASRDRGVSWKVASELGNRFIEDLIFTDSKTGFAASDDGEILRTTNCGRSWDAIASGLPSLISLSVGRETGWVVTEDGRLFESDVTLRRWSDVSERFATERGASPKCKVEYRDVKLAGNHGFIGFSLLCPQMAKSAPGGAFITEDGGENWKFTRINDELGFHKMFVGEWGEFWLVTDRGSVSRSIDIGKSWMEMTTDSLTGTPQEIAFRNSRNGWLITRDGDVSFVYSTKNSGANWDAP